MMKVSLENVKSVIPHIIIKAGLIISEPRLTGNGPLSVKYSLLLEGLKWPVGTHTSTQIATTERVSQYPRFRQSQTSIANQPLSKFVSLAISDADVACLVFFSPVLSPVPTEPCLTLIANCRSFHAAQSKSHHPGLRRDGKGICDITRGSIYHFRATWDPSHVVFSSNLSDVLDRMQSLQNTVSLEHGTLHTTRRCGFVVQSQRVSSSSTAQCRANLQAA